MKKVFSPEHWALVLKLEAALGDMHFEECDTHYTEGFKLGVLVGIECAEE